MKLAKHYYIALLFSALVLPFSSFGDEVRPGVMRTPDHYFENLPGYNFEPNYKMIRGYRVHYVDSGPEDGEVVLMLHGEPTWSYLYRKMIPILNNAGYRTIAPDLIGFGKSDKPTSMDTHSYVFHVDAMTELVEQLDLNEVTFFGQDWGGLIGLRVVAENEKRFARVVIGNTGLPAPTNRESPTSGAFANWKAMNQRMIDAGDMNVGTLVAGSVGNPSVAAAYDAPFPDARYKAGPLILPQRVPVTVEYPGAVANAAALEVFSRWDKPFLTAFSDGDPITAGNHEVFQDLVPGAEGQPHTTIRDAGHFLQEQKGEELAEVIVEFIRNNPL